MKQRVVTSIIAILLLGVAASLAARGNGAARSCGPAQDRAENGASTSLHPCNRQSVEDRPKGQPIAGSLHQRSDVLTAELVFTADTPAPIVQCTTSSPFLPGVECSDECGCYQPRWNETRPIPFQAFLFGEYIGPHRLSHLPEYRLRVGDQLEMVFRKTVEPSPEPYRLNIGDQIRVLSYTDANLDTLVTIQPDGMITLRLLDQVRAEGRTIEELEQALEQLYSKYYRQPSITVKPEQMETRLNELRASVDSRFGFGGQGRRATVAPDGTIQLPAIGSLPAQGLTTDELKREINERYRAIVYGIEVTPVLAQNAPRFVYVIGEVNEEGRYELTGPTTVIQAITLAKGWRIGGNLRQIVIFRRTEDWRLIATRIDLRGALFGQRPCPADDLWVRDSDIIIVPKSPIQRADDFIHLWFRNGLYGVVPNQGMTFNFSKLSTL